MMIYPATHYTMGGLWVDYELMTTIPGLFAIGEANFSDHGANRLGASALMQGLADGYFVLPYTIQNYLAADIKTPRIKTDAPEFIAAENKAKERISKLLAIKGKHSSDYFHKKLGHIMWEYVGMGRTKESLTKAIAEIKNLNVEFHKDLKIPGTDKELNPEVEKAMRVEDFIELGELIAIDALHREESCGGHFREEYQTKDGDTLRNDKDYKYVGAWEYKKEAAPELHKEPLDYEFVELKQRDYK
jgi:succinate dehydrogenase / fumarate reductase flavoprotein subunit